MTEWGRARRSRRGFMLLLAALPAGMLSGCGGDDEDDDTAPATASPATGAPSGGRVATPPPAVPTIGDLVWTTAVDPATNAPVAPGEAIPASVATIYIAVQIVGRSEGAVVGATWTYNDVPLQGLDSQIVVDATGDTPLWAEFHLTRSDAEPWPEGRYTVTIAVNGEAVKSATVEVVPG